MSEFDRYSDDFESQVGDSISFSGMSEQYFTECKARHIVKLLSESLGDPHSVNALDVGCGTARIHGMLDADLASLTGVDVTQTCLDRAARENPKFRYELYDGLHLPFGDDAYDFCFAVNVFHHVPPANWPALAREMTRVTRPGGIVAIFEHNPLNPLTRVSVARCEFDADAVLLRAGKCRSLIRDAGVTRTKSRYITFLPIRPKLAVAFDRFVHWLPAGAQYYSAGVVPSLPETL